jgi:DNA anti-recombination protein RmuC
MRNAEDALKQGDLDEASNQQGQALEQMRQSAQKMAEQMQQNGQQRLGRGGNSPRDPLGRPQRAQGPDLGTSVKVPDQIDAQRAREILDELRKRSGENLRPQDELEYIDRLLKRF